MKRAKKSSTAQAVGRSGRTRSRIKQAHEWCQHMATKAMEAGRPCAVSNTFTRLWEMEYYRSVAKRLGYEVSEVVMRGEWPNVHGVSEYKVRKMREQFEYANPNHQALATATKNSRPNLS